MSNNLLGLMSDLAAELQKQRFNISQEKRTQMDVEQYLMSQKISFEREKRLSGEDIPDFFIFTDHGNIVLEVKIKSPRKAIYRQLERYAKHHDVNGIILLTGTSMNLPSHINEKPAITASLGAGWL